MLTVSLALSLAMGATSYCPAQRGSVMLDEAGDARNIDVRMMRMLSVLDELRNRGGWPHVEDGPALQLGDRGPRVQGLRERLAAMGDLTTRTVALLDGELFDEEVLEGLKSFQRRHGIPITGALDERTTQEMRVPLLERRRAMLINLERARWVMALDRASREVWVNVPAYEIWLYEEGRLVDTMRAVVGSVGRKTPAMSHTIEYLVIHPSWLVPRSIVRTRILPRVLEDPEYLSRGGYELRGRHGGKIEPSDLDWSEIEETGLIPYMVTQRPGPGNAMGQVKFMFPNEHRVYLHDTPERALFQRERRAFSFGCVRVERPDALTRFLLRDAPEIDIDELEEMVRGRARGMSRRIDLQSPVPIHIVYLTSWVDEEGTLHFRHDLYGRDAKVLERLDADRPEWDATR